MQSYIYDTYSTIYIPLLFAVYYMCLCLDFYFILLFFCSLQEEKITKQDHLPSRSDLDVFLLMLAFIVANQSCSIMIIKKKPIQLHYLCNSEILADIRYHLYSM